MGSAQAYPSTLRVLLWAEMTVRVAKPRTLGLWIGAMVDAGTCFQEDITDRAQHTEQSTTEDRLCESVSCRVGGHTDRQSLQ